ncbi:hypothetical protein H112_02193 [Trichophyton rubrum D6]|uniref:Aminoglycoside phosphotransferase domain-containing protein n=3 Tax=Trichophyton TaxID=5550 RepID=A0A080WIN8_TRIRC|nr:uncharacterized protein TERG_12490 [Trichophyton rubrum CBS 118892]EZF25503.1 hypothetical protein H100_02191 [Trichophyton rubrum MR850]EZF44533.1 hypothetical protein H102_02188 [Trichophyton rubrum CBS 100081]EZF55190.1 hypothetical protein H103_02197 [Trichophyton rubrum CBS 288.86]EZF65805.1 hypothetical protein H104_02172 [Trichophyton rubrum CBS 289.86]EZF76448.1 hypothetical protein H105_02209 [Trichophyton soudanense CBS 452.61]EZF87123.1 hypothetical protein H110_02193 [Trichophy
MLPEEKYGAAIRYIEDHASIPAPFIVRWGTKDESLLHLGLFIITDYIDRAMDLGEGLDTSVLDL